MRRMCRCSWKLSACVCAGKGVAGIKRGMAVSNPGRQGLYEEEFVNDNGSYLHVGVQVKGWVGFRGWLTTGTGG